MYRTKTQLAGHFLYYEVLVDDVGQGRQDGVEKPMFCRGDAWSNDAGRSAHLALLPS